MHILHVVQSVNGGVPEYLKMLLPRLRASGVESDICCSPACDLVGFARRAGYTCHVIPMSGGLDVPGDLRAARAVAGLIRSGEYDLVHAHSSKAGAVARLASALCGVPCAYTPHGWAFHMRSLSAGRRGAYLAIERILSLFCRRIVAISRHEMESGVACRVAPRGKFALIENGVDCQRYLPRSGERAGELRARLGLPATGTLIVSVGRLCAQKDPQTFLATARIVAAARPDAHFVWVGDGELRGEIEPELRGAPVTLAGWTDDVAAYIRCADIGLHTARWEGFGMAVAELMSGGKPVVAPDVDGVSGIIDHDRTGILCPPGDAEAFARAVLRLLDDEALRARLGRCGQEAARNRFDIRRVAEQHLALYAELKKTSHRLEGSPLHPQPTPRASSTRR